MASLESEEGERLFFLKALFVGFGKPQFLFII